MKASLHSSLKSTPIIFVAVMIVFYGCLPPALGLAAEPATPGGYTRAHYVLPPDVLKNGISFATVSIPLNRKEVTERILDQLNYLLMDRRAGMLEWFDRMAVYGGTIDRVLEAEKVPRDFIYLSALLSDLKTSFRTRSGGVGWWALGSGDEHKELPVAKWFATNDWDDRRDPVLSTRIACRVFQWLHSRKETQDWLLTICAYVDGTSKIDDVVKKAADYSYWDTVMPPRSEIMIPRLIALRIIDTHRELYGVNIPTPRPLAYDFLERIKLSKDLPLHQVAQWCETNPRAIWELNPGVDPSTGILPKADKRSPLGYPLRVPKGTATKVQFMLKKDGYLAD
ncbi:MAG: transglycosylase SLT domain-containing protein [Thermodesulfobacteriota bacterium]